MMARFLLYLSIICWDWPRSSFCFQNLWQLFVILRSRYVAIVSSHVIKRSFVKRFLEVKWLSFKHEGEIVVTVKLWTIGFGQDHHSYFKVCGNRTMCFSSTSIWHLRLTPMTSTAHPKWELGLDEVFLVVPDYVAILKYQFFPIYEVLSTIPHGWLCTCIMLSRQALAMTGALAWKAIKCSMKVWLSCSRGRLHGVNFLGSLP